MDVASLSKRYAVDGSFVTVRAAFGTGAEVRLTAEAEQAPAERVGARLRYRDSSTG